MLKAVNVLAIYLCSVQTNQSKLLCFKKLANQSLINGALVMEIVNNSFSESKKNLLDKVENVLIEKNKNMKICFY